MAYRQMSENCELTSSSETAPVSEIPYGSNYADLPQSSGAEDTSSRSIYSEEGYCIPKDDIVMAVDIMRGEYAYLKEDKHQKQERLRDEAAALIKRAVDLVLEEKKQRDTVINKSLTKDEIADIVRTVVKEEFDNLNKSKKLSCVIC